MTDIIKIDDSNIIAVLRGSAGLDKPFAQNIYLIDAHVAGTTHVNNIEEIEPGLRLGMKLKFLREPENPYDKLAIKVMDENNNKIGYVPRGKNEILSRLMDAGKLLYGTIYEKDFNGDWLKITMQIYLAD
ncbi:MAG: HIRAN domain-containing protein [Eubacteriales bacterium]